MIPSTGAPISHSAHARITRRGDHFERIVRSLYRMDSKLAAEPALRQHTADLECRNTIRNSPTFMGVRFIMINRFVRCSLAATLALAPSIARGQDSTGFHVSIDVPDSVAHIVERERPDDARFSIVSRDGQARLLLMDTTIVAQLTDRGLAHMGSREATDSIHGANKIFARMALGALTPLLDHGIAYHLRDLADARYEDGRLQLLRANGDEVFRDMEIGKGPLMESFSREDAKAFAARARAARARLGR
jgi:hypothetical protein